MRARSWRWVLGVMALAIGPAMLSGCNPFLFPILVAHMCGYTNRAEAEFEFPEPADPKKPHRVAILTYADVGTQLDAGKIDHELNRMVAQGLWTGIQKEGDEDQVRIITSREVSRWQNDHPDWRTYDPQEIGKALRADYLITIDIESFRLRPQGGGRMFYQGSASLAVRVIKTDLDGEPVFRPEPLYMQFPKDRPLHDSDNMTEGRFRQAFLGRIAERIVWYFIPHEATPDMARDPL